MIKIIYFNERKLMIKKKIKTKAFKNTEAKITELFPDVSFVND